MVPRIRLVQEPANPYLPQVSTADEAVRHFEEIAELPHEELHALLLDRKRKVLGRMCVSVGDDSSSMVAIRTLVRAVLLSGADAVILAHNHPSGDMTPSRDDVASTRRIQEALKLFDVELLDHFVVSRTTDGFQWSKISLVA